MQYIIESNKCIIAPLLCSPGMQETKGSNQTYSSENADLRIPVRARSFSAERMLYIPTITKYSTTQKVLFGPQGAGGHFPRFAIILLTCQERILNPILGSRDSFMQNTWKVLQARTGTQASLYSGKFPTMLESYVLFCVISLLLLSGLINSPVCSSTVTWSVQIQNRQLAVARELLLISMLSLSGSRNFELFSADHNNSPFRL